MNIHKLARTTPSSRGLIAARRESGVSEAIVATQLGVDRKTVRKWTRRKREGGEAGLQDRSSRPRLSPNALAPEWRDAVEALRRLRFTQARIAEVLGLSKSRVQRNVAAQGLARLSALEPPEPDTATSESTPASSSTWTPRSSAAFTNPATE